MYSQPNKLISTDHVHWIILILELDRITRMMFCKDKYVNILHKLVYYAIHSNLQSRKDYIT